MRLSITLIRLLAVVLALLTTRAAFAGPGELDIRFGTHGWLDLPQMDSVAAATSLPDGSIVVVGDEWPADSGVIVNPHPETQVVRISATGIPLWSRNLGAGYAGTVYDLPDGRILVGLSSFRTEQWGEIVALHADGGIDASFGQAGRLRVQRTMVVSGAGETQAAVFFNSFRMLPDGNLLISGTVPDETISTPFDPATMGVLFRISVDGRLLDSPTPGLGALSQRQPSRTEVLADGRGLVIAAPGCCRDLQHLLISRAASGELLEVPSGLDPSEPLTALTIDASLQRFYVRGTWNSGPAVVALNSGGEADSSFGNGVGRVDLESATGSSQLMVAADGSLVSVSSPQAPDEEDIVRIATSRARLLIARWNAAGIADSRFDGNREVPLADTVNASTASVAAVVSAETGCAWVASSHDSYSGPTGRLTKLQLDEGTGPGVVGFQLAAVRIAEHGPSLIVFVVRSGGSDRAVSVRYEIAGSTTTGLRPSSGVLQWADGDATPRQIEIAALDDTQLEGEQVHAIHLLDVAGGASLLSDPLKVTIEDDEALAQVRVTRRTDQIVAGRPAQFVLSLAQPVPGPVSLTAVVSDGIDDTGEPRYQGRNSAGWIREFIEWQAGQSGERVVTMNTNLTQDPNLTFDLYLRLVSGTADLLRATSNGEPIGAMVKVVGGSSPGAAPTPAAAAQHGGGGGLIGMGTLALLGCMLIARASPGAHGAFKCSTS